MTFHVITIFPELIKPYLEESILGRAVKKGIVKVKVYNLRDFTHDKHNKVDDRPYGGGPGMVMGIEPLARALEKILKGKERGKAKVIITSPAGRQFNNRKAELLAGRCRDLVLVAGHYEGLDERIIKVIKGFGIWVEELSIGPYVLTGGELPSLVVMDAVARQIKGVLGKEESLEGKRLGVGVPVYTRPENFQFKGKNYRVPKVLLSGDHKQIESWRRRNRKVSQ
jgi:tRNA (guanine37-N1)-methyltransferase